MKIKHLKVDVTENSTSIKYNVKSVLDSGQREECISFTMIRVFFFCLLSTLHPEILLQSKNGQEDFCLILDTVEEVIFFIFLWFLK